jgi:membrane-bound ClpP family serine protease
MKKEQSSQLPFGKINYILLITGVVLIVLGYVLIAIDKAPYGFGILGITIGPITLVLGFIIQFFAIMYTKKRK